MKADVRFSNLGWRHEFWQYIRLYNSVITGQSQREELASSGVFGNHSMASDMVERFRAYLAYREKALAKIIALLRTEDQANRFCNKQGIAVGVTATKSTDHHQSTKPMVATVSRIAEKVAADCKLTVNSNPQKSCVWTHYDRLSVTARNLDGAIPGLENPCIIWEIKEYWGKTRGGSKMSDAVYECMLVGMELRLLEEESDERIGHVCLIDGRDQWECRCSDLRRLIDILNQGFLDALIVGKEVETKWEAFLRSWIDKAST